MNRKKRERYRKQCIETEKDIISYFARHPKAEPDGSFVMSQFIKGWDVAKRDSAKLKAGKRND
jgi:hypothetical protein